MLVVSLQDRLGARLIRQFTRFPCWDSNIIYLVYLIFSCTHPSEGKSEWKEAKCDTDGTKMT